MNVPITTLYCALLGCLMSLLSLRVPLKRGALNVPFGDGGNETLATRIRAFANFTEYVPFVLAEMLLLELTEPPGLLLHGMGATLLLSRGLHAASYRAKSCLSTAEKAGRATAAMSTWSVLTLGALALLYQQVAR